MRRLGAVLLVAAACSSDDPPPCEPAYAGGATDEVWLTMLDGEDRATTGASSPVVTAPAAGATLGAAPRITWTSPLGRVPASRTEKSAARSPVREGASEELAGASDAGPPTEEGWRAKRAFSTTHAAGPAASFSTGGMQRPALTKPHLPPVTGDVHFVRIAVPGRACPVARLTTELAWQLDASEWSALQAAAGQPLSLTIVSAYVTENRITEGPFRLAEPRAFTAAP